VIALLDKLTDLPHKRNAVDLIYLEFSKAFNIIPHEILLVRLDKMGISSPLEGGKELEFRRQPNSCFKRELPVCREATCGLPQTSVSGAVVQLKFADATNLISPGSVCVIFCSTMRSCSALNQQATSDPKLDNQITAGLIY